ncbi:hypothetical protein FGG08_004098 [Glutinoglossum americanum]|uniref:RNA polymerase II degradation factor 1 n=1 Tax=Glutinoglossum americanum TaxID=1670608 RepID=A0A9P8I138_9PEZI|nr:hypothetical protein FGG08_004098 [Glutinoglossum americanum]
MSETQVRPSAPRGRGSSRGGRGTRTGQRGGSRNTINGNYHQKIENVPIISYEDEGELGELKRLYSSKLTTIKEMFPDWTDEDIVFALHETSGDLESTIERITEGNISQWGEVKKKSKDRSRSKVKEPASAGSSDATNVPVGRGGRGGRGGFESARGGRGRGSDRGRRGGRGGSSGPANGLRHKKASDTQDHSWDGPVSIPTEESLIWATPINRPPGSENSSVDISGTAPTTAAEVSGQREAPLGPNAGLTEENVKASTATSEASKKTWASMFAKPAPTPVLKKTPPAPSPQHVPAPPLAPVETPEPQTAEPDVPPAPPALTNPETTLAEETPEPELVPPTVLNPTKPDEDPTPKDDLTEVNLEKVLDTSAPAPTTTVASTIDSAKDSRSGTGSVSPFVSTPTSRPPTSGYATSAHKATGPGTRTSSFQRRVLDQREAVVMPGNHAVDRAAVQFGSLGLNGADDSDVDEDREEAETRTQPPQHSPAAHPVASLPPAPQHQPITPIQTAVETVPTPRQAPGLPAAPHQQQAVPPQQPSPQPPLAPQSMVHQTSQGSHQYGQFGRYGQQALPQDQPSATQKQYESFGQQSQTQQAQQVQQAQQQPTQSQPAQHAPAQQQQYEGYPSHSQAQHAQPQHHQPTHAGAFSSAGNEYSSYYTSDQSRGLQNYYATPYGQQNAQSQQDAGAAQQRSSSGFGGTPADPPSQFQTTQAQQTQPRYGQTTEAHTGGQTTPNPTLPGQQPQGVQPQQPHIQHPQSQAGGQGAYPYGHPYYPYQNPAYAAYLSQVGVSSPSDAATQDYVKGQVERYGPAYLMYDEQFSGYNSAYGASFGGKGAMYGQQPHQGYGISPQTSFEHSSTPAGVGGFGQPSLHTRDNALGAGLGDYGRSGSAQPTQTQQHSTGSGAFAGIPDVFGRSGFQAQNQQLGQQQNNQQGSNEDSLKPFSDSKPSTSGPSPSLNQPGRPGSATNNTIGGPSQTGQPSQTTLPPQSQSQPGFSGYPSHHLHGSQAAQYGGLSGLGGHGAQGQNHQNSGYGNYGAGFGSGYYGSSGRGGWGGNYGGH